ncbi:MAG: hypothetical protein L0196_04060 [candidate division Zixibacteria bacterium]|nr:hypothetical protein [candidate division Zixibacteria bacterium]
MQKFILLLSALFLVVCTSARTGLSSRSALKKILLCGAEYENWAWGYHHYALYVDNTGNIDSVKYTLGDSSWTVGRKGVYSEVEIQRLLKNAIKISRKIPEDTLKMILKLIKPASEGKYTEPVNTMADAGSTSFFAFLYDSLSHSFKKFDLSAQGDWKYENTSESARRLDELLRTLLKGKRWW